MEDTSSEFQVDEEDLESADGDFNMIEKLNEIGESCKVGSKTFVGIPSDHYEIVKMKNEKTHRYKLIFRCKIDGCSSEFKKSCNLRDHFRKHTGQRPFECKFCQKTFT